MGARQVAGGIKKEADLDFCARGDQGLVGTLCLLNEARALHCALIVNIVNKSLLFTPQCPLLGVLTFARRRSSASSGGPSLRGCLAVADAVSSSRGHWYLQQPAAETRASFDAR